MQNRHVCPECGGGLPVSAGDGLCTKCLLKLGLEQAAGGHHLHVRCPHCRNPIEIVDDTPLRDITCPSCDSKFSLVGDETTTDTRDQVKHLGQFELIEQIGLGGFGAVWKAKDTELDRVVAVKVPRTDQVATTDIGQFMREARAAAQLKHPNIVSVHEVGRAEDIIYIVSDYVDGVTLADWLSAHQPTPQESAGLCAHLAEALQHAHAAGVIHRDLKPSNIMIDAGGKPHIMDFGLAKREAGEITMTVDGKVLGTPAYMSPEQASGKGHTADARSDIYSLGVILFEMLTGEKPFRGTSRMLLHQVIYDDAPQPRKLNNLVPEDLETICLKCLEKDLDRRYETARQLEGDLRHFLTGRPISARPITNVERAWRWSKRNPLVAGLATIVTILLLAFAVAGPVVAWQRTLLTKIAVDAKHIAEREAARAVRSERETGRLLYTSDLALAHHAFQENELLRVNNLLERHRPKPGLEDHRGFEWYYLWRRCHAYVASYGHETTVWGTAFSPVDDLIATTTANARVHVWNYRTGQPMSFEQPPWTTIRLEFSRDGSLLVGSGLGATCVWKVDTGNLWQVFDGGRVCAISPDGTTLAVGMHEGGRIYLWNLKNRDVRLLGSILDASNSIAFSPDGALLVASGFQRQSYIMKTAATDARVWDLTTFEPLPIQEDLSGTNSAVFSLDGKFLCFVDDETVRVWSVNERKTLHTISSGGERATFAPDGIHLAVAGDQLELWSLETIERKGVFPAQRSTNSFSRDGTFVAAIDGNFVRIWRVDSGVAPLPSQIHGPQSPIEDVAIRGPNVYSLAWRLRDGKWVSEALTYNIQQQQIESNFELADGFFYDLTASPGRPGLAVGEQDGKLKVWNLDAPDDEQVLGELSGEITVAAISHDGSTLAVLVSGKIQVWDVRSGSPKVSIGVDDENVELVLSPNGQRLAVAYRGLRKLVVIDPRSGQQQFELSDAAMITPEFSANSRYLAFHELNQCVTLVDAATGEVIWEFKINSTISAIAFSPDGKSIALSNGSILDLKTGQLRLSIDGPDDRVMSLSFSDDGKTLVAGAVNGKVTLIQGDSGDGTLTPAQRQMVPEEPRLRIAMQAIQKATVSPPGEQIKKSLEAAEALVQDSPNARPRLGMLYDLRASNLAMNTDPAQRLPDAAVELAEQAVEILPLADWWITLGVSYYRAGRWGDAITALNNARQRVLEPDAIPCFVLAMSHWQLNLREEARRMYRQGESAVQRGPARYSWHVSKIHEFQGEAADLLEVSEEDMEAGNDGAPAPSDERDEPVPEPVSD